MPKGQQQQKLDLSLIDVEEFLTALGVTNLSYSDSDIRFSCPYPEHSFGDKSPSAYMSTESTAFICFSCGRTGNAITFLSDIAGVPRTKARYWIGQKWSNHFVEIDHLSVYLKSIMDKPDHDHVHHQVLDEAEVQKRHVRWGVDADCTWGAYMTDRGFTPEILAHFEVGYDSIMDRPVITVRDDDGSLVGFKGRAWNPDQQPKYMIAGDTERGIATYGHRYGFAPYDASQYVFGLDKAVPVNGSLIFCEGELNVISMHQKGFTNAVGPSGSTVTETQVRKIARACDEVIVFFDSDLQDDARAFTAKMKVAKVVDLLEPFVSVRVVADHEGDPAEMPETKIRQLIDESESAMKSKMMQLLGVS